MFFSQYGRHARWLVLLTVTVMSGLCLLRMKATERAFHGNSWIDVVGNRWNAKAIVFCAMLITAGAMIAAAGHMTALVWEWHGAYSLGVLGTLIAAWGLGSRNLKALNGFSALLTAVLLFALAAAYSLPVSQIVYLEQRLDFRQLIRAVTRVVGYASFNITLAGGVICTCAQRNSSWKITAVFGVVIAGLMLFSARLYGLHPELMDEAFPFVLLVSAYGRKGYLFGVLVLYLAILTTLISLIYSLRSAAEAWTDNRGIQFLLVLALPMAISRLGFAQIVERYYATAGLICLAVVDIPLICSVCKRQVCS